ncbi:hypothetical protein OF83DRAFT_246103 [Amylostereum chailletii]|nr:hypothetical protein OF83DRAFT_246103 [Amylostereum chailletii]
MARTLATAHKYKMDSSVSVLSELIRGRSDQPWSMHSTDPFKAYFIACKYSLEEEAVIAARSTLFERTTLEQCIGWHELNYTTGPQLYALRHFRNHVLVALRRSIDRFSTSPQNQCLWIPDEPAAKRCNDGNPDQLPDWLRAHLRQTSGSFPCIDEDAFNKAMYKHAWTSICTRCQEIPAHTVRRFWVELKKTIFETVEKVRFNTADLENVPWFPPTTSRTIPPPAFARPDADFILRSSDEVDFAVYKSVLAIASPFFESMFSLPAPVESQGTVQICRVTETSKTLNTLLSFVFPIDPIIPTTVDDAFGVLNAAQKYDMGGILRLSRILFFDRKDDLVTARNAFRAYGLAFEHGLRGEALHAARLTLDLPMTFDKIGRDLYTTSGRALCALRKYRVTCFEASLNCLQEASGFTSSLYLKHRTGLCKDPNAVSGDKPPWWWLQFFQGKVAQIVDAMQAIVKHDTLRQELSASINALHSPHGPRGPPCMSCSSTKVDAICTSIQDQLQRDIAKACRT